jgi:hypothetical protein
VQRAPARIIPVPGSEAGSVPEKWTVAPGGILLSEKHGVFKYDESGVIRVPGEATGGVLG